MKANYKDLLILYFSLVAVVVIIFAPLWIMLGVNELVVNEVIENGEKVSKDGLLWWQAVIGAGITTFIYYPFWLFVWKEIDKRIDH